MAISLAVQTLADTEMQRLKDALAVQQEAYKTKYGLYWQGLRDRTKTAGSQYEGWENMPAPTISYSAEISDYHGPQGRGYEIKLYMTDVRTEYVRVVNVGPETYRDRDWTEIVKE